MQKNIFFKLFLLATAPLLFSLSTLQGCKTKKQPEEKRVQQPVVDHEHWKIENGKFYLDGEWQFLKIGKPLINFSNSEAVDQLIQDLDILIEKNYQVIEMNCY